MMTFEEILDQAIAMLQRRGRVSYRALQRQFQLDDAYLQDLTAEIVEVLQLAVDQDHTLLIWTGGPITPAPLASPSPNTLSLNTQERPSTSRASVPSVQHTPEAERRQLTVMFCDLVASTQLSRRLDPEDLREVVRAYQTACTEVIQRFDGHIAQLLGDGLLVYFGYPQAHEDDAQRAVRTGLGMLAAMGDLNTRLQQAKGLQLAIRIGIHTGLVVVGDMGSRGRQEQLALGETPNIAARIQGLAQPNTVTISDATYRLVQGYFQCQDLGAQPLRGVTESLRLSQVLCESGATSRLDVAQPRGLTPLVGRESEVALLLDRWEQAKAGQGQVILLSGDAGIGKSRLVHMLKEHVAQEPHVPWECRSTGYTQNTALFPLTDLFQRLWRFQAEETPDEKLAKLEHALSQYHLSLEESVPLFAPLLSLPLQEHRYPLLNVSPQRQRQKTLETIVAILLELAERHPMFLILEDLHWTDPTTLEWLNLLIEQTPTASILVLLTCRPHFHPAWHHRSYITEMTLNHLSHAQVEQIVTGITNGKTFPAEVLQQVITRTDGVPLFVEEMTKAILESEQLRAVDGHYELVGSLSTFAIPATLHDSLMARLDRLVTAKGIAQMGATIGRQFAYDLLQAVSQLDASTLQRELGRLVEAEIVYQRGLPPQATYVFKHALIQDAAYQSLLKSTRHQYHQRIAQVLEAQFPETAETQPELLAHHFTEAGLTEQAVPYWHQAGQSAIQRSAHVEAISHLTKGLELLKTLPDTPQRAQRELTLHITLGQSLVATKGYAASEVEQTYNRAQELCQQAGVTPQLFQVLQGFRAFYVVRAELEAARELSEHMLRIAQELQDPSTLLIAHREIGHTLLHLGEFSTAHMHLEQGIIVCASLLPRGQIPLVGGQDSEMFCLSWLAHVLWLLGYPEQAGQRMNDALVLARKREQPFNLAVALHYSICINRWRGERHIAEERSEASMTLSREYGFAQIAAIGMMRRSLALTEHGHSEEGLTLMHQGLTAYCAAGAVIRQPMYLAELAEAHRKAGQAEEGLTVLTEALALVQSTKECWWEAELHRLKGQLLLQQSPDNQAEAESCFHQAITIAQSQHAKSWELRAATSLARLWHQQGKRQEAHDLLAPIYGWFTEGFDTADLQEAKALLDALA